jgi:hypothetical protein
VQVLQPHGFAQSAERTAEFVANNIFLAASQQPLSSWPDHCMGVIPTMLYAVSLGKYDGTIGALGNNFFVVNGFLAALVKHMVQFLKVKEYEGT